jgi:23S rRNA (guanosine2251-2'-O)-methyltransferase
MEDFDLVIGIHSIITALQNPDRTIYRLVGSEESIKEIKKSVKLGSDIKVAQLSTHKVQEEAKGYFKDLGLEYHRVPSSVFLVASALEIHAVPFLYDLLESKENLRIVCLDQVTDVHNAGAILRTASFYGVDAVIVPDKKSFGLTPSFFRIASGAAEFVPMIGVSKLNRTVAKLKEAGILCLALSEHAKGDLEMDEIKSSKKGLALILGREDVGISNAVLRMIDQHISLDSMGDIKSLNVSIAAAVTMEKCFSNK